MRRGNSTSQNVKIKSYYERFPTTEQHSPGALTADQHKVGDDVHSTKTTVFMSLNFHFGFQKPHQAVLSYLLWRPVDSLVPLYKVSDWFSVGDSGTVNRVRVRHKHRPDTPSTAHSHKGEHGHDGRGEEELDGQDGVHLKTDRQGRWSTEGSLIQTNMMVAWADRLRLVHFTFLMKAWRMLKLSQPLPLAANSSPARDQKCERWHNKPRGWVSHSDQHCVYWVCALHSI